MIKWLLTGLEDAYSSDLGVASKVWDYLDMEMPCAPRPAVAVVWDDAQTPAAPAPQPPPDDDVLWRNCMWGGRCGSHDHGAVSSRCAPKAAAAAAARPPRAVGAGESLLKTSAVLRAQQPSPPPSPPPEVSDSEKEMVFVSMTDVVCDVRWMACPVVQSPPPLSPRSTVLQVHEDHSYHLTTHPQSHSLDLHNLGVQTPSDSGTDEDLIEDEILEELPDLDADDVDFFGPESVFKDIAESVAAELRPVKKSASDTESNLMSDSDEEDEEEEIDVVSVAVEKARVLPTNPSMRDRRQLQQTVADAVCRRPYRRRRRHRRRRCHRHLHRRRQAALDERDTDGPSTRKPRRLRRRPASDTEDWSEEGGSGDRHRRSLHNNMERQRRIDLSNLVRTVRNLVPSLGERERAPRIVVLREAAHYCRQLQVEATQLAAYKQELARHNSKLRDIHQGVLHDLSVLKMRCRPGRKRPRRYRD